MSSNETIEFSDFLKVELRVGTVVSVAEFPEARKPAYILNIDFGDDIGVLKSSAQITERYVAEDLIGKQVVAVVNFAAKQIGPIKSQCLVTGFYQPDGTVTLCVPNETVPNGAKLC